MGLHLMQKHITVARSGALLTTLHATPEGFKASRTLQASPAAFSMEDAY
jgi:hypothetical protein